ncbi:hypothetical protein [uncultured Microbacterium sp.]|uniref:hypothetical protein n=1 Tax=uncultured Microbacterium sp. TaxID=191216 RepID=UPI0025D6830E|nr:hypothetical protein [uncultured Microbacterium sp.]
MTFPLSSLLRVRGVQERVAAQDLSRARAEHVAAAAAHEDAVSSLSDIATSVGDPAALLAMAAARSAGQAALADLRALTRMRRDEVAAAEAVHVRARRDLRGLERLDDAHRLRADEERLRTEQNALDEIATSRAAAPETSGA